LAPKCIDFTINYKSTIVLKSGILKLLEPSWPVQACNGIALPLLVTCFNLLVPEFYI